MAVVANCSGKKKVWSRVQKEERVTVQTLTFKSVSGIECCTWWEETPDDHLVKASLRKVNVDKAIPMLVFNVRFFEPIL